MRARRRFWMLAAVLSVALFAAWWAFVVSGPRPYFVQDLAFTIPVIAVMLASKASPGRKAAAIGVLMLVFSLGDRVAYILGAQTIAQTGAVSGDSLAARLGGAAYHAFRIGLPVAALLLFSGLRVSELWEPVTAAAARERRARQPRAR